MRTISNFCTHFMVFLMMLVILIQTAWAVEEKKIDYSAFMNHKKMFDDPRPFLKEGPLAMKNMLPSELYRKLTYDVNKMKTNWADVIGFRAPEVVEKIAPEIKPGTYGYKDKEKYPGLKELMIPELYERFKPGGPPFSCNFSEIKVVPTRQYYYSLPIAEATKKYEGEAKLDNEGYLIWQSYRSGLPFPKPSGKFKAQEIMYNWDKRYLTPENTYCITLGSPGFTKNLKQDKIGNLDWWALRLEGRVQMEPYGWYDDRAQKRGESYAMAIRYLSPRDSFGNAFTQLLYADRDTWDYWLIYINTLRRIRTMTTSDTQDSVGGSDSIYEDREGFSQKLSPKRFPYQFKIVAEREYLVPFATWDGSTYVASQGLEIRNVEFERRPMYVVELTQMDKNYVYGRRVIYIDKETFLLHYIANYDQKGRLYRDSHTLYAFIPEMGYLMGLFCFYRDHIDLHSTIGGMYYFLPAPWVGRDDVNLSTLTTKTK
jgi:hypothetical protein